MAILLLKIDKIKLLKVIKSLIAETERNYVY